ncbi:hypothetical protein MKW94_006897 [Papaver nudicaule]|uniref:RRM domain-containing protein n=1 Tax=Papaver nudicaule TaxID=74823 RepID=A0AA41SGG7_PAPNU|nr:hypothetical protein [Papaver nudicaule]
MEVLQFFEFGFVLLYWLLVLKIPWCPILMANNLLNLRRHLTLKQNASLLMHNCVWKNNFGFCCKLDNDCARKLKEILKYWFIRMVVTKAQMVVHCAQILSKMDAHISWKTNFGFCWNLTMAARANLKDTKFGSENQDFEGDAESTERLFVTGLSFYTSEKTLRAAFESFGDLVELKILMDKISKRFKGYAFTEYTIEEVAGAAINEMNGKVVHLLTTFGWMIVFDVAITNPT